MNWLIFFINISFVLGFLLLLLVFRISSYKAKIYALHLKVEDAKKQTAEFEALLQDSEVLVYVHDISGKITYINGVAESTLGLNPDILIGKSMQSLMYSKKGISWDDYIQTLLHENEAEGTFYLINSASDVVSFAYKCRGIFEDNSMVGVNGHAWRMAVLGPTLKQNIAAHPSFEKKMKLERERYKNTAHNLKNIFAAVLGFSEIIKEEKLSRNDLENYNAEICAAGKRGIELLGEWLDFSDDTAKKQEARKSKKSGTRNEQKQTPALKRGKGRILYVDDDKALLLMYTRFLEKLGYSVEGFANGNDALLVFEKNSDQFDLIITDWMMPEMSGKELAGKIKTINRDVPIIVLSGKSISEKISFNIFSALEKPVDPVKMSEIISEALSKKQ